MGANEGAGEDYTLSVFFFFFFYNQHPGLAFRGQKQGFGEPEGWSGLKILEKVGTFPQNHRCSGNKETKKVLHRMQIKNLTCMTL